MALRVIYIVGWCTPAHPTEASAAGYEWFTDRDLALGYLRQLLEPQHAGLNLLFRELRMVYEFGSDVPELLDNRQELWCPGQGKEQEL